MTAATPNRSWTIAAALLLVALVVAAAGAVFLASGGGQKTVTAYFDQTVNLYAQDEVRVLGVEIGRIESVEPLADRVRVVMRYDAEVAIPADATAAIISPTLVGVRYVQLGPPWDGGPVLEDGAEIPMERTVAPVEFDQIKTELAGLADALAPKAEDTAGALNRLLDTTSANLDGQGPAIRATLDRLSRAAETLGNGRQDFFATVRNLQTFVTAIKDADAQVVRFQSQLAEVSGVLADNREALGEVLAALDRTAPVVERFVRDNRDRFLGDVGKLNDVVHNLAQNRQALADLVQKAPFAISNFTNFINENSGAVTANVAATNFRDPAAFVCDAIAATAPGGTDNPDAAYACRTGLGPLLELARVDVPPVEANPLEWQDGSSEVLSPPVHSGGK